jgi:acetyltransferase-like isoleucine patch superfamily enzyme
MLKLLWTLFRGLEKAALLIHTFIARPRFAAWGPRSRLGLGAILESPELIEVGANVGIGRHAWLNAMDDRKDGMPTLRIGDGTYIGRFAHINAWRNVRIGRDVLIADRVFISDCEHAFADTTVPIRLQGDIFRGNVTLMDGCWIGVGAVILPGVTVGRNAVVAANSVVNRDVAELTVVGGVPAKFIRKIVPQIAGT